MNVPPSGCPQDNGADVCQDPTCDAVYACDNGKWVFDHACPAHPADAGDAGPPPKDSGSGAHDADIDAPPGSFGGPGCNDLQPPDCPLGIALECTTGDCCGCVDLYVCQNGGWNLWGQCLDGGVKKQ